MKFRILIFFLLASFPFLTASASPEDTAKKEVKIPTLIKYIHGNAFSSPQLSFNSLDTSLTGVEIINPSIGKHYNNLSNLGSASSPQLFQPASNLFTETGFHSFDLYLIHPEKIRYFKTNKAYSEINYHLAGGKEQQINVSLSESILKNWNIGLDFTRLGALGYLKNGTTFHSNIDLYTWLHSENNRYNLLAFAYWNYIENNVNGGVHSDSLYDNSSVSNLALQGLLVNLTDAESHFRNREFSLKQYYDLGSYAEEKITDSTTSRKFKPSARIEHAISLKTSSFSYLDNSSGSYYQNSYYTSSTLDSLHFYDLRNKVSFSSLLNTKNSSDSSGSIYYSLGLEHQWFRYSQLAKTDLFFLDSILTNTSVFATVSNLYDENKFHWKINGSYLFAGENKADYKGEVFIHSPLSHFGYLNLSGQILLRSPDFIFQRYYSNHFIWKNVFEKSSIKVLTAEYSFPKYQLSIGANLTSVTDFLHLDSTAVPTQEKNEIQVLKFFLNKNFKLGKFHFNNSFITQKVNNEDALHLPEFISTQSLFYESFFFKSALLMQIGLDLHFHSLYYSDAFMPATGFFYWQNEKKTGGYALADFFVNFRIKSARFFVKLENISDNIIDKGYYLTPHYPMQGMTLQFGVRWRFFDQ